MRESTWHRVGPKNARFVLARRNSPNGVRITGGGCGGSGGGDGGQNRRGTGNVSIHDDKILPSPASSLLSRPPCADSKIPTRKAMNEASTEASGVNCGPSGGTTVFKTPNAKSRSRDLGELGRTPPLARGAAPGSHRNCDVKVNGDSVLSHGKGDAGLDKKGGRNVVDESEAGGMGPWKIRLSLSEKQREIAKTALGYASRRPATMGKREEMVNIRCHADHDTDMYQLGRMQGPENDFAVQGPLYQSTPSSKGCGPVSRYAARLLVERAPPYRCRIFTGGFNSR